MLDDTRHGRDGDGFVDALREAGFVAAFRPPGHPEGWNGWEDSAVPPERLGEYLRDMLALYEQSGYERPALFGHFGHGCVHLLSPFDLRTPSGVRQMREFMFKAADLVAYYGGSVSGEHGDGRPGANFWSTCSARTSSGRTPRSRRPSIRRTG